MHMNKLKGKNILVSRLQIALIPIHVVVVPDTTCTTNSGVCYGIVLMASFAVQVYIYIYIYKR